STSPARATCSRSSSRTATSRSSSSSTRARPRTPWAPSRSTRSTLTSSRDRQDNGEKLSGRSGDSGNVSAPLIWERGEVRIGKSFLLSVTLALAFGATAVADEKVFVLKNGRKVQGELVDENATND